MKKILKIFFGIMIIATATPAIALSTDAQRISLPTGIGTSQPQNVFYEPNTELKICFEKDYVSTNVTTDSKGQIVVPKNKTGKEYTVINKNDIYAGTARDKNGKIIPNADVTYKFIKKDGKSVESLSVKADANGKFELENYPCDATLDKSNITFKAPETSADLADPNTPDIGLVGGPTDNLLRNTQGEKKLPGISKNAIVKDIASGKTGTDNTDASQETDSGVPAPVADKEDNDTPATQTPEKETVTKCDDGFALVNGKCEPKLSEKDSAARVDELRDNALAMKDKEQSTANKLLGGASIGATGIGASQFLGAKAEQSADDAAERDMRAYLATFRCDYGGGMNITGGETEIMLPGGNELFTLYNEYKDLATNLKTTKEALGLLPGIESETVFDKASTGLYDNAAVGRTGGAYTSLSRALSDETSADAAAWAAQRAASAEAAKTGAIIAGAGIVGGIAGNLALNTGKNAAKESSAAINAKYAKLANATENLKKTIAAETPQPEEKSGEELDSTPLPSDAQQKCNGTWTGDRCDCGTGAKGSYYYDDKDLICRCSDINFTYPNCKESLVTVEQINVQEEMKKIKAEQPVNATTIINKTLCDVVKEGCEDGKVTMKGVNFEFNKFTVLPKGIKTLEQTAQAIKNIQSNEELKDVSIRIMITGHTDNIGSDIVNDKLSQQRADEAKKHLVSEGILADIITTAGLGKTQPIADNKTKEGRANNRRVEIQVLADSKTETQQ